MPITRSRTPGRTTSRTSVRRRRLLAAVAAAVLLSTAPATAAHAGTAPGEGNTGVPSGVSLRAHHGDIVITEDGTVIDGLEVFGLIRVEAANVTIKNTAVRGRAVSSSDALITARSSRVSNLRITDVTLAAKHPSPYINGIYGHDFTLRRAEIRGVIDSVHIFGDHVDVYNSWMHDNLHYASDPTWGGRQSHDDNIQIQRGSDINITSNTMSGAVNTALMITQDAGDVGNVKFSWNRVSGGSCSVNIAEKRHGTIQGLRIRNNSFGRSASNCNMIIDRATKRAASIASNSRVDGRAIRLVTR